MADNASESPTRPSLLLRLRDPRDAEAWRTFVDVYGPLVYGHCRRRGLRHEDAEDVTQKVFARVSRAIPTFDHQPGSGHFRNWLGVVVRNEVSRFWQQERGAVHGKGGVEEDVLEGVAAPAADTEWAAEFHAHVLQTALARSRPHFADDTWRAFEAVWVENRPAAQVAQELNRAIDWVYVAKSRVLKHLWEVVLELADDVALLGPETR